MDNENLEIEQNDEEDEDGDEAEQNKAKAKCTFFCTKSFLFGWHFIILVIRKVFIYFQIIINERNRWECVCVEVKWQNGGIEWENAWWIQLVFSIWSSVRCLSAPIQSAFAIFNFFIASLSSFIGKFIQFNFKFFILTLLEQKLLLFGRHF